MPYANVCRRPGTVLDPESTEWKSDPDPIPAVRLQWSREASHVQMAIQPMLWSRDQPLVDSTDLRTEQQLWATLGRYEINQLIKQLRTARDQAFGRDE